MIKKLQNQDVAVAKMIRSVFLVSYAVEAKLLNAIDFPPLKRPLESYVQCENDFYGYNIGQELAGVVEVKHEDTFTHIQSLVVHPDFFRQGAAKKLMEHVLVAYDGKPFMVETGAKNGPAIQLYKKFQFNEVCQWETDHGVRKVRFERGAVITGSMQ